ncbi:tape measure protein [Aerococcaceae bacterium NML160702]|nr:tape measure protein [Aerococcaceae bacterium NML160702]
MSDGRVEIKIIANSADLKKISKELQAFVSDSGKSKASLDKMGDSADKSSAKLDKTAKSAKKASKATKEVGDGAKGVAKVSAEADKTAKSFDNTSSKADKARKSTDGFRGSAKAVQEVADSADKTAVELAEVATSAKKADSALDGVDGKGLEQAKSQADGLGKELDETAKSAQHASTGIKQIVTSLGLVQVASKALSMIKESLDGAIARYDTLSKFPRMMQAIGYESTQTQRSMRKLSAGIEGLPTRLDSVVSTAQRIAFMTGDLGKATDTTLALNNAFLASGASAGDAERGLVQYLQMLSSGKVDMQSWKTLQETMSYGLTKVAEEFGFTGESATRDFYGALRDGEITFGQFNAKLVNLDKGVGGFAELAKENSKGIATSFANIKTAVVKGVADTIGALNDLSKELTGKDIADNIDSLKDVVKRSFKGVVSTIKGATPVIKSVTTTFGKLLGVLKPFGSVLKGVTAGFVTFKVLVSVLGWLKQVHSVFTVLKTTKLAYISITKALTAAEVKATVVQKALAVAYGVLTGKISLVTLASQAFGATLTALGGPLTLLVVGMTAAVAVATTLNAIFNKTSPEVEELTNKMEEASKATQELSDSIADSSQTYVKSNEALENQSTSYEKMAQSILELAGKEDLSAGQKKMLKDKVEDLNEAVKGLNLSYDEEAKKLNLSAEAIKKRIEIAKDEEKLTLAKARQVEVSTQLATAQRQLESNTIELNKAQEKYNSTTFTSNGANNALLLSITELKNTNSELETQVKSLSSEEAALAGVIEDTNSRIVSAQQSLEQGVITSLEQLTGAQREAAEGLKAAYAEIEEAATNMFEKISTESKLSVDEMIANLEHNQQAVANWGENLAILADRGVNQGILDKLKNMGPEGAGYVQALANASDEKLQELNTVMENGGKTATEALEKAFDVDSSKLPEGVKNIITETDKSLTDAIEAADWSAKGKQITDKIAEEIKNGETTIKENTQTVVSEGVSNAITEAEPIFNESGGKIPTELGEGITNNKQAVTTATEGIADEVPAALEAKAEDVKASGTGLMTTAGEGIEAGKPQVGQAAEGVADTIPQEINSIRPEVEKSGAYVVEGFVNSVDSNAASAEAAASNLAQGVDESFAEELGIHSPSRVFMKHGSDTVQGLINGVKSKHSITISTITALAQGVTNAMRSGLNQTVQVAQYSANQVVYALGSAPGGAYSAGADTGWGFYNGLAGTAGSIYSLAASIAHNAAATIRSALRIKSPSRVMMEIGAFVGQGLEYGMASKIGAIQRVANRMAEASVPKIDVGATLGNIGGMYGTSSVVYNNQQYTFTHNSSGGSGQISREEERRLFNEFKWYLKEEGARM